VTEFNYRISDERVAHVFVGLAIQRRDEAERIERQFSSRASPTSTSPTTNWPRSMCATWWGGRSALARDERLFRFEFPERPGALMRFLAAMHPGWNISLFHYRNQGADYGRILVGIQVPPGEEAAFDDFLRSLAYPCAEETNNPVYGLFLR
jgi:threonine dehydratase